MNPPKAYISIVTIPAVPHNILETDTANKMNTNTRKFGTPFGKLDSYSDDYSNFDMYDENEGDASGSEIESSGRTSTIMVSTRISSTEKTTKSHRIDGCRPTSESSDIEYKQRCSRMASAIDALDLKILQDERLYLKFGQSAPFVFDNKCEEESYTAMTPETVDSGNSKKELITNTCVTPKSPSKRLVRQKSRIEASLLNPRPDPFYGDQMDESDQKWVDQHLRSHDPVQKTSPNSQLTNDANLSCPCCFLTVCMESERHVKYQHQYRALHAINCRVCRTKVITQTSMDRAFTEKSRYTEDRKLRLENDDEFFLVQCSDCVRAKDANDPDAIKIKCISLIRLENFDKALELAQKYAFLSTEKLYCSYRLKKDNVTLAELKKYNCPLDEKPKAILHIEAQLLYRMGEYAKCIEIYEYLREHAMTHEDILEIETNLMAAHASGNYSVSYNSQSKFEDLDKGNHEVAYNKAFMPMHAQDWNRAEAILADAKRLYRESLDEDATTSEIDHEMAHLRTQLAYVRQMKGDFDEAVNNYRDVIKARNPVASAVATNNLVVIRKDRDLLDSLKKIKSLEGSVVLSKMSLQQQRAVHYNKAVILCLLNKPEDCLKCVQDLMERFPDTSGVSGILVTLANTDSSPHASKALQMLQNDKSVDGRLGLAYLKIFQGKLEEAAQCIMSIDSIQHTPGTVATLVCILEAAHKADLVEQLLTSALQHQDQTRCLDSALKIREGMCIYKLKKKKYEDAALAFKKLLDNEGGHPIDASSRLRFLASFVICLSYTDPEKAKNQCAMLPGISEVSNKDPIELERLAPKSKKIPKAVTSMDKKNDIKRHKKSTEQIARQRAKKREAYLADLRSREDYNPSIGLLNPDPERWIPRKQRASSKRSRRGRNRFVGAQGAGMTTEKDAMRLDAAARAAAKQQNENADKRNGPVVKSSSSALLKKAKKKRR
uniref:Signal recognition particle putative n=1 Tax=Albugo laibachii Nc14 TaxID=890382 RepID=F0WP16_9STRA|nr:signal recognition particle putative [Albugo laibachii Nc14]|eukprot:CCA23060.1 signal recognition particle putative [Albugo laibachii Nc14]